MNISLPDFPGLRALATREPQFPIALLAMCDRLGLDPNNVLAVMSLESGFQPGVVNPTGGATGLIQFMPDTAKMLGTSTDALKRMSAVEQLQYVERFFKFAPRIRRNVPGDYYMTTFMPAFVGADASFVLGAKGSTERLPGTSLSRGKVYEQNQSLDVDQSGTITVGDVWKKIEARLASVKNKPALELPVVPLDPAAGSGSPAPLLPQAWRSQSGPCELPVLRFSAKGSAVSLVQRLLGEHETGVFTQATLDAVRQFQREQELRDDGVVGPYTWERLCRR